MSENMYYKIGGCDTHPCVFARKGVGVDEEFCRHTSGVVNKNEEGCTPCKCKSPWRNCKVCVCQMYKEPDAVVVDASKGLCAFHEQHGTDAYRPNLPRTREPGPRDTDKSYKFRPISLAGRQPEQ